MLETWGPHDAKVWVRLLFEIVCTMGDGQGGGGAGGSLYTESGKGLHYVGGRTEVPLSL
jgi:hypothetical protein